MRILLIGAAALIAPASAAAPPGPQATGERATPAPNQFAPARSFGLPDVRGDGECRRPTAHTANDGAHFRGDPVTPRNLAELPPAETYMAVYRVIDGCEEPMTVVEYRRGFSR